MCPLAPLSGLEEDTDPGLSESPRREHRCEERRERERERLWERRRLKRIYHPETSNQVKRRRRRRFEGVIREG